MAAFVWFWFIVAFLVVLAVIFSSVFFSRSARKRKVDKLDEALFRKKR